MNIKKAALIVAVCVVAAEIVIALQMGKAAKESAVSAFEADYSYCGLVSEFISSKGQKGQPDYKKSAAQECNLSASEIKELKEIAGTRTREFLVRP